MKCKKQRLVILQLAPLNKIIGSYFYFLAQELKNLADKLVIVSNGELISDDIVKLEEITKDIFIRKDSGYDCGAFKDTLENYLTWNVVCQYEELVLVNDSCYGPLYPLEDMFEVMNSKENIDFWTITKSQAYRITPYSQNIIPYHVQPYFLVVRKRLLKSALWKQFWDELEIPTNYFEAVRNYELAFTNYFIKNGFDEGAYIDESDYHRTLYERQPYIIYDSYELISKYKCPFVKRKAFHLDNDSLLVASIGEVQKTLAYIKNNTGYDQKMIWEDLLSKLNPQELINNLGLYVVLNGSEEIKDTHFNSCVLVSAKEEECLQLINELKFCDIKITTEDRIKEDYEKYRLQYRYICVFYGYTTERRKTFDVNDRVNWNFSNLVQNGNYIQKVIEKFEDNPQLGMLFSPRKYVYYKHEVHIDKLDNIFYDCNAFWIRTDAVKGLETYSEVLMENIANIILKEGYYSVPLYYEGNIGILLQRYQYMIQSLISKCTKGQAFKGYFSTLCKMNIDVYEFCARNKQIYIYGAGDYGQQCLEMVREINCVFLGFIVSDGYKEKNKLNCDESIVEVSEIKLFDEVGIIIACEEKYKKAICEELQKKNFNNYIMFLNR